MATRPAAGNVNANGKNKVEIRANSKGYVPPELPTTNILGGKIDWELYPYSYSLLYNTARGKDVSKEFVFISTPLDIQNAYKKIKNASTYQLKLQAIQERITKILVQINYLGYRLSNFGISVNTKSFWETVTPFLVNKLFEKGFSIIGVKESEKYGQQIGTMVIGYVYRAETKKIQKISAAASFELRNLDAEAKALYQLLEQVKASTTDRSANTTNNDLFKYVGIGLIALILLRAVRGK